jgi:hypothetical protein
MLIPVNEMQHLRWANQLLWELHRHAPIGPYAPVLRQATRVPAGDGRSRHHRLRRLTPAVLDGFVEIERPRGLIDGAYGRVIATLRQEDTDYPPHMAELAEKIASDGMLHESQFLQIRSALKTYYQAGPPYPYLRKIRLGTLNQTKEASLIFGRIVRNLTVAYTHIAAGTLTRSARYVAQARTAMDDLMAVGEDYAARGIGIRFRLPFERPFRVGEPGDRALRRWGEDSSGGCGMIARGQLSLLRGRRGPACPCRRWIADLRHRRWAAAGHQWCRRRGSGQDSRSPGRSRNRADALPG